MGFSDIFDPIVNGLEQRRQTLIRERVQTLSNDLSNRWTEKVNVHQMDMEQQGKIGEGYSDEQSRWFQEEESKILSQIKDPRVKEQFKQSSSGLRTSFTVATKKKEIDYMLGQEVNGVKSDVNFQLGLMSSAQDGAALEMDFKTNILPNINRKIDGATNEELRNSFKENYALSFENYVDSSLSLLEQQINRGSITQEDYKQRLSNLQTFITKDPEFYRNIPDDKFARILGKVRTSNEQSSETYKVLRNAKILSDLPALKQVKKSNAQPFAPEEIDAITSAYSPEKQAEARLDLEAFNAAVPYYQAKNEANIPAMLAAKQEIEREIRDLTGSANPGARLTILQKTQADLTADLNEASKLSSENYYEFIRNSPKIRLAEQMAEIDPKGYNLVIDAVIDVANQNNEPLTYVEFLSNDQANAFANNLSSEGVTSTEARTLVDGIYTKFDRTYPGGNVADNVIRQVSKKLGGGAQAAMNYYDDPKSFQIFWDSTSMKPEVRKEMISNLSTKGVTEEKLKKLVNASFVDLFSGLDQEQQSTHRDLAVSAAAYILSSPNATYDKKIGQITNVNDAIKFVHDKMVKDTYGIVQTKDKNIRVPKKVKGTDYTLAANVTKDPSFRQSTIDWFNNQNPNLKLHGDFSDKLVLDERTKSFLNNINKQKLHEAIRVKTSGDGMGVQLYMSVAAGQEIPIVFKGIGEAVIPFNVIQTHKAFLAPYSAATSFGLFFNKNQVVKDSRKDAKKAVEEDVKARKKIQERNQIINDNTFFDSIDSKALEDQASNLTNEAKQIQGNLQTLEAEMAASEKVIKEALE